MALAIAGCAPSNPKPKAPEPVKAEPPLPVTSGGVEITARRPRENGPAEIAWVVRAATARGSIALAGQPAGPTTLEGVTGDIYRDGVPVTHFSSKKAQAEPATGRLELSEDVKFETKINTKDPQRPIGQDPANESPVTMTADRAHWMEGRQMIVAQGNVNFRSDVWSMGPSAEQWATRDLTVIGTPDQFP